MRIMLLLLPLTLCWNVTVATAQEALPTCRILPIDVEQNTIKQFHTSDRTNLFTVGWTYTESGAKKMLAFRKAHEAEEVQQQVGEFEFRGMIFTAKPKGWTEEGWLKSRTDAFWGVTEEDAKKIIAGLMAK
jgi:hypothetical protein